ncbi:MAG: hypothetical protein WC705_00440 [Candidatus Paceibacterota bacterium]|jgi:hypothetical protein
MDKKIIFPIVALLLLVGAVLIFQSQQKDTDNGNIACTEEAKLCPDGSAVGRTGPNCEFAACPLVETSDKQEKFNKLITMRVTDKIFFPDNLSLTLKEINDSRCKPDVQCIWQGELSGVFSLYMEGSSREIQLGTVNNREIDLKDYTLSLEGATENSMTIMISVNPVNNNIGSISGYIHVGPVCPVQEYPENLNCADRPFTNAQVNILVKSSGTLATSIKSDTNGNFNVNLYSGTYLVKVLPESNGILPSCFGKEAIVTANKVTNLDISCDSGIR